MQRFAPAAFCLLIAGCMGEIGDTQPVAVVEACDLSPARGLTFDRLRRLSSGELTNTLTALLGADVIGDTELQSALSGVPADKSINPGDFVDDAPVGLAIAMQQIAQRAATLTLTNTAWREQHLPTCASATIDDACAQQAIVEFGTRVLRRDLTGDEIADQMSFFTTMGGGEDGLQYAFRRLLQSPSVIFHIEAGGDASDGSIRLTDFEVASRISYLTAGTMPDDELLDAARNGELQSLDGVRTHVTRLLATSEARAKVHDFFRYYTRLEEVADPLAKTAATLGIRDVTGLGAEMRDEAFEYFERLFWGEGSFYDLMSSTDVYPRSEALATVFGTSPIADDVPTTSAAHVGLLHRPGLLASVSDRTSPIIRGAHLLNYFLCESLGTPPADAVSAREEEVGNIDNMSNRDRVTKLTDSSTCMGCHTIINSTGFAFESFDQLGAARTSEVILDDEGAVTATWPIDTTGSIVLDDDVATSFSDSRDLALAIAASDIARECVSQRLLEYYRTTDVRDSDSCALSQANALSKDDSLQSVLVSLVANDDIFWRKEP